MAAANLKRTESIILLHDGEGKRSNPEILNPSRKHRIARGAGVDIRRGQPPGEAVRADA